MRNGKKKSKRQVMLDSVNEYDNTKATKKRELSTLKFKIRAKFKNKKQKELSNLITDNKITFITGSPGSGKTFIALKTALELLQSEDHNIGNIMLSTPIVEVGNSLGFLPGDTASKTSLYFEHFYDNINKIAGIETTKYLRESKIIKEKIINFMRGATFGEYDETGEPIGCVCILDEAQNLDIHQIKTYISRMGEDSKLIIMGDVEQKDIKLKYNELSGLEDAIIRFQDFDNIAVMNFTDDDIVRDPFLIKIMKKYKEKIEA